jgi:hypothetical protein
MSTTIAVREDDELPVAICREHEAASAAARSALGHALECGRLLAQARQGIAHGGWESFVRDRCGIAPRTARLYLRLDANRERLANRQRAAGLTVREAARLLAEPRAVVPEAVVVAEVRRDEPAAAGRPLALPEWYRPGHWHNGRHPSGWIFNVWPHPSGGPWVHAVTLDPVGNSLPDGNMIAAGPKRGVRIDALPRVLGVQVSANGMPSLADPAWEIDCRPCDPRETGKGPHWNIFLFNDEADYLRRGLGLGSRRNRKAEVPA